MRGFVGAAVVGVGVLIATSAGAQQQQQQQQPIYVQRQPAMSGPREITTWEEGDPIPPGYHSDTRVRKGLIIGGAITFGVTYLLSALFAAVVLDCNLVNPSVCSGFAALLIPAAGPFITIGTVKADGGGAVVFVIDGIAQTGGLAMLVLGIAIPRTVLVRNDLATGKKEHFATIEPMIGGAQNGLKISF